MYYQRLSDDEIIESFREGNSDIIRNYFYGYCEPGYRFFDQRYQLSGKQNLDFMSLAHQYAIYLMDHNSARRRMERVKLGFSPMPSSMIIVARTPLPGGQI